MCWQLITCGTRLWHAHTNNHKHTHTQNQQLAYMYKPKHFTFLKKVQVSYLQVLFDWCSSSWVKHSNIYVTLWTVLFWTICEHNCSKWSPSKNTVFSKLSLQIGRIQYLLDGIFTSSSALHFSTIGWAGGPWVANLHERIWLSSLWRAEHGCRCEMLRCISPSSDPDQIERLLVT